MMNSGTYNSIERDARYSIVKTIEVVLKASTLISIICIKGMQVGVKHGVKEGWWQGVTHVTPC